MESKSIGRAEVSQALLSPMNIGVDIAEVTAQVLFIRKRSIHFPLYAKYSQSQTVPANCLGYAGDVKFAIFIPVSKRFNVFVFWDRYPSTEDQSTKAA
jgi:hypothetical protein